MDSKFFEKWFKEMFLNEVEKNKAIVMDNAIVKSNCLIAAGAVVLENTICESNMVYAGVPAKPIKQLDAATFEHNIRRIADNYVMYSSWF